MDNFSWPLMENAITPEDTEALIAFIRSTTKYTNGERVRRFESEWSKWLGCKHTLFVSSGSTANLLLLSAIKELLGWQDGAKILVPCCTWSTNISPVVQCKLEPVFCDVNLYDYSFDIESLKRLENRNEIVGIFVTHLLGIPAPIDQFREIFPNAVFLEDCCESHGAELKGRKVGTLSFGSTFSTYYGHHMTSVEGGMVCTDDSELYKLMKIKRSHGLARELPPEDYQAAANQHSDIDPRFLFLTHGYNFRNTEFGGVLASEQLKRLDSSNEIRRRNFRMFVEYLQDNEAHFYVPKLDGNCSFCLPFICKKQGLKDVLLPRLDALGVETRPVVGGNLLKQPFLKQYSVPCPNADILNDHGFYIGNSQFVTEDRMRTLFDQVNNVLLELN
jgi:CDP-6-deoxy-D-xylo-4-hexulose-3-dehydrase